MGRRLVNQKAGEYFFVTASFDGRRPLGDMAGVYGKIAEAVNIRAVKTGAKIMAYVFMPSHIHIIMKINGEILSAFMRDFKKYTAQKALSSLTINGKLWQDRYDRVAIWSEKILLEKVNYIHHNPVKAGFCEQPERWRWSSAADYLGRKDGPVKVWIDWYE